VVHPDLVSDHFLALDTVKVRSDLTKTRSDTDRVSQKVYRCSDLMLGISKFD
jgi:hypothetical protein